MLRCGKSKQTNISPKRESQGKITCINLKSGYISHGKLYIVGPRENNSKAAFIYHVHVVNG